MVKGQGRRKFLSSSSSSSASSSSDEGNNACAQSPKPRIVYTPNGDQILELTIETLMGTTFEVRLPAKTLVASIKNRFQRSEGVPRHHLHIIHGGKELPDEFSLKKCNVKTGDKLKLVLAMRGGPINTRRVALPISNHNNKQDLQSLMLKNKEQILEKMPKNGQVTVLLFREGDKVNVYHVLEKPDGSYSPLSNGGPTPVTSPEHEPEWKGSGHSLKRLLEPEDITVEDNPKIKQRLKENAITMNKMAELRTQMESLSMLKKTKRRISKKSTRPKSGKRSSRPGSRGQSRNNPGSRMSTWSASTNGSSVIYKKKPGSSMPLPPISAAFDIDELDLLNPEDEDFCTIHPLSETTNNYRALPSLSKNKNSSNNSTSNVPDWLNDSHYYHGKSFPIKHHPKAGTSSRPKSKEKSTPSRNIDLLDLQFRPENSSLEIVNHRKTQKLMSTEYLSDMQHMLSDSNKPTKSRKESSQIITTSGSNANNNKNTSKLQLSSDEGVSPRSKAEQRKKWIKSKKNNHPDYLSSSRPDSQSTMPLSESRDSLAFTSVTEASDAGLSIKTLRSPMLPFRSGSTGSKNSRLSANSHFRNPSKNSNRPKYTANTLNNISNKRPTPPKKKANRPRCATCNKKINITNTFSCRCEKCFCPKHRHPELHHCTFDYKAEGKKQLEENNPVISVPKLPKI